MRRLRLRYGASPVHLVLTTVCLAFAGYIVWTVVPASNAARIFIWIGIAAAVHDLVLWPLYAVLDRALGVAHRNGATSPAAVPWINHVRVPVVLSAVALLISFPLVLRHSEPAYRTATGLTERPYLGRWVMLTVAAFTTSGLAYVARVVNRRRKSPHRSSPTDDPGPMIPDR